MTISLNVANHEGVSWDGFCLDLKCCSHEVMWASWDCIAARMRPCSSTVSSSRVIFSTAATSTLVCIIKDFGTSFWERPQTELDSSLIRSKQICTEVFCNESLVEGLSLTSLFIDSSLLSPWCIHLIYVLSNPCTNRCSSTSSIGWNKTFKQLRQGIGSGLVNPYGCVPHSWSISPLVCTQWSTYFFS